MQVSEVLQDSNGERVHTAFDEFVRENQVQEAFSNAFKGVRVCRDKTGLA